MQTGELVLKVKVVPLIIRPPKTPPTGKTISMSMKKLLSLLLMLTDHRCLTMIDNDAPKASGSKTETVLTEAATTTDRITRSSNRKRKQMADENTTSSAPAPAKKAKKSNAKQPKNDGAKKQENQPAQDTEKIKTRSQGQTKPMATTDHPARKTRAKTASAVPPPTTDKKGKGKKMSKPEKVSERKAGPRLVKSTAAQPAKVQKAPPKTTQRKTNKAITKASAESTAPGGSRKSAGGEDTVAKAEMAESELRFLLKSLIVAKVD